MAPSPQQQLQQQQLTLQLRHEFARLVDKDPDARRSGMEALKAFIEGELDEKTMSCFLEQVSGERAISLFVEVARVHKRMIIPFLPRIMISVVRSLSLSAGAPQNIHQACAKVVSSLARHTIDNSPSSVPLESQQVLSAICQPLLGVLCSKLELVAVGSATCLQALVDCENWKFAVSSMTKELCYKAAMALCEKGTQTVAHINLLRSLVRFNAEDLNESGAQLLKSGVDILAASRRGGTPSRGGYGGQGSWQQRAAAAQLLGVVIRCLDQRALGPVILYTLEALKMARLDKVAVVRQAVGKALTEAKGLVSQMDPLLLQAVVSEKVLVSPTPTHGKNGRSGPHKKSLRSKCPLASKDDTFLFPECNESPLVSYASSPSSSFSFSATVYASSSVSNSAASRISRSPLYPAQPQMGVLLPSSADKCMSEFGLGSILACLGSSESKENTPSIVECGDLSYSLFREEKTKGGGSPAKAGYDDYSEDVHEVLSVISDNGQEAFQQDGSRSDSSGSSKDIQQVDETLHDVSVMDNRGPPQLGRVTESTFSDNMSRQEENHCRSNSSTLNVEEMSSLQVGKARMTAEDFLLFATPRRLVQSLQAVRSTPDLRGTPKSDLDGDSDTSSESGWSVRDNPIAGEDDDYFPRKSNLFGILVGGDEFTGRSWDSSGVKMSVSECSIVTQEENLEAVEKENAEKEAGVSSSTDSSSLIFGSLRCCKLFEESVPTDVELDKPESEEKRELHEHDHVDASRLQFALGSKVNKKFLLPSLIYKGLETWASCAGMWAKVHDSMVLLLQVALTAVLVFPMIIVVVNYLNELFEGDVLVPT